MVDRIQQAYFDGTEGIVINPAAYTHTSVAILDALKAVRLPAVEVHISDVKEREDFRQISYAGKACVKTIMGRASRAMWMPLLSLWKTRRKRKNTKEKRKEGDSQ